MLHYHKPLSSKAKDGNCNDTQSFDLDVCTLFGLCNASKEIFCFIFRQLWRRKISPQKLPHSFCNSSDYRLLMVNKTWFQPIFFQACAQCITFGTTLILLIFFVSYYPIGIRHSMTILEIIISCNMTFFSEIHAFCTMTLPTFFQRSSWETFFILLCHVFEFSLWYSKERTFKILKFEIFNSYLKVKITYHQ